MNEQETSLQQEREPRPSVMGSEKATAVIPPSRAITFPSPPPLSVSSSVA